MSGFFFLGLFTGMLLGFYLPLFLAWNKERTPLQRKRLDVLG
jgi:hypothetical protein